MTNEFRTIDDLDVEGRRVLLRADFNVPITPASAGGPVSVADDTRIRAALSTIEELRRRGARLVLSSHLGRPKGPDPALSMRPVADRLENLTGASVPLAPAVIGPRVCELTERLEPGQMLMLENVRFEAGETDNDPALASALAELADLYVDDAFASAHRAHASTCGVAHLLPSVAGRLMEREVNALGAVVERPARPLVAILGGAKIGDKSGVVRRFLDTGRRRLHRRWNVLPVSRRIGPQRRAVAMPARGCRAGANGARRCGRLHGSAGASAGSASGQMGRGRPCHDALPGWSRGARRVDGA